MNTHTLIAGCGYVGNQLGREIVAEGGTAWGLRRTPDAVADGIKPIVGNLHGPADKLPLPADMPRELDHVVYAASPSVTGRGGPDEAIEAYRTTYISGPETLRTALALRGITVRRWLLVSSTGAFGIRDGRDVDETTRPEPDSATAEILLEAEDRLRHTIEREPGVQLVVARLAGIYGPERSQRVLERWRMRMPRFNPDEPAWMNWVHRDDAAGAILHLLRKRAPQQMYIVCDSNPQRRHEFFTWLYQSLGLPAPEPTGSARVNPAGANKRLQNDRLRDSGYQIRVPSIRDGLAELIS